MALPSAVEPADIAQHVAARARGLVTLAACAHRSRGRRAMNSSIEPRSSPARHEALARSHPPARARRPISRPRMMSLRATSMPGEIVARIGLGVAALPRIAHDVRERLAAIVDVEEVGERAGENALDAR